MITAALASSQVMNLATDFKTPGADMDGFFYLRNVVDADALVAGMKDLKEKGGKVRGRWVSQASPV